MTKTIPVFIIILMLVFDSLYAFQKEPLIRSKVYADYPAWSNDYDGEFENACPNTCKISTTSTLKANKGITYEAKNMYQSNFDNTINTAWVEGVDGSGIGEKIRFKVVEIYADYERWRLSAAVTFINGYAKNEKTWKANNRVKKLKMYRNGKSIAEIYLEDTPNVQTFSLGKILYDNLLEVDEVIEFEIMEVYKGDIYDDTAITFFSLTCSP
ncbi:NADase-type glycan-binding domain-containing protein [Aquimarina algiphila]|uniref:NADase-type glycan-binding domain-containing protein n=1 Tax=Aquimarina algiphila TaxID=2047982 RepID=UPI00232B49BB|nr:hypothetical protein [Aquimarina algiphila]